MPLDRGVVTPPEVSNCGSNAANVKRQELLRRSKTENKNIKDSFYSDPYAAVPVVRYLKELGIISTKSLAWDPFGGAGDLAKGIETEGLKVVWTDKFSIPGRSIDFYKTDVPEYVSVIVTNTNWDDKVHTLEHLYAKDLPFAAIFPLSIIGQVATSKLLREKVSYFLVCLVYELQYAYIRD